MDPLRLPGVVFICSRACFARDKTKGINYGCFCDPGAMRAIAGTSEKRSKSWEDPPTRNAHRDNGWKRRFDQEIAQIRV
jgi:hypothetical protein